MRWELLSRISGYSDVTTTSKTLLLMVMMLAATVGWRLARAEPDDCADGVCRPPQGLSGSFSLDELPKIDQARPVDYETATFALG